MLFPDPGGRSSSTAGRRDLDRGIEQRLAAEVALTVMEINE
jgi:hypothetical protein